MGRTLVLLACLCLLLGSCRSGETAEEEEFFVGQVSQPRERVVPVRPQSPSGHELFYADSLNAFARARAYPVPEVEYTPAPKGYKPVYISSYARHGSRKLLSERNTGAPIEVLECADSLGRLTPFGKEVLGKLRIIDRDLQKSLGDLTSVGEEQHRGIAERMWENYPNVFSRKGTPVRLYSTQTQRTILSMFACNEVLLSHNPKIVSTRQASKSLTYLEGKYKTDRDVGSRHTWNFLADYFDPRPALDKLFTGPVPALKDTMNFIENMYNCGSYVPCLDVQDADFIWDLFTLDELYIIQQAVGYWMYVYWSNSPQLGDVVLPAVKPLLKDFVDKADAALEEDVPGADLRFGHDIHLLQMYALIGLNGFVKQEEDRLKVIDTYQDFAVAPTAGNFQMVFYRNRAGNVLVKFLRNEVEAWLPLETDSYPYYHWDDVRNYFNTLINR